MRLRQSKVNAKSDELAYPKAAQKGNPPSTILRFLSDAQDLKGEEVIEIYADGTFKRLERYRVFACPREVHDIDIVGRPIRVKPENHREATFDDPTIRVGCVHPSDKTAISDFVAPKLDLVSRKALNDSFGQRPFERGGCPVAPRHHPREIALDSQATLPRPRRRRRRSMAAARSSSSMSPLSRPSARASRTCSRSSPAEARSTTVRAGVVTGKATPSERTIQCHSSGRSFAEYKRTDSSRGSNRRRIVVKFGGVGTNVPNPCSEAALACETTTSGSLRSHGSRPRERRSQVAISSSRGPAKLPGSAYTP
jgi:hypothetical protein